MAERQNKIEKDNLNLLAKLEEIKKKGTMTSKVSAAFRLIIVSPSSKSSRDPQSVQGVSTPSFRTLSESDWTSRR